MLGLTLEPLLFLFVHEKPEQFKHHADYDLTPRELRLLKLLAEGHNHNSAAAEFADSFQIAFHIQNIYEKLQVHSKSEAVAKAMRHRLLFVIQTFLLKLGGTRRRDSSMMTA